MQPDTPPGVRTGKSVDPENRVRDELRERIGARNYDNWFAGKVVLTFRDDQLTIGVASPFLLNWMQKQFRRETTAAAQAVLGSSAVARFSVDSRVVERAAANRAGLCESGPGSQNPALHQESRSDSKCAPSKGRRFADLADFVTGPCNEMAFLAATQVAENPGTRYNPLFLHGGVGTGKTHVLEGIYRSIRRQTPALKTMYLTSEGFTNYFMRALREHTLPGFRQRFRTVDVLLVDDIGFLNSKPATQEEFLHTFQQLENHGRQIVLTADRHPRLFSKMSEELTTRFLSGLVCRLETPELETRLKIVERKSRSLNADISPEALRYVAGRFKNSARELEGALNCLATYHTMTGKRVGRSAARQVLAALERDCIRAVRLHDVERAVCDLFGVNAGDLKSAKRHRSLSQPRMLAMFLCRKLTRAAYSEIGEHFGGRNHSTVISAEKKVRKWLDEEQTVTVAAQSWPLDEVLATLEQQLQAS